jgi:hypothetical protein
MDAINITEGSKMKICLLFISLLILSCNAIAEDAVFDGHAVGQLGDVGAWGWFVFVDNVISGPGRYGRQKYFGLYDLCQS